MTADLNRLKLFIEVDEDAILRLQRDIENLERWKAEGDFDEVDARCLISAHKNLANRIAGRNELKRQLAEAAV